MSFVAHLDQAGEGYIKELQEFLRIPSISSLASHHEECQRASAWLASRLTLAGLENVCIYPTAGHPIVYGDWLHAPGAPTVLLYGHYDVQPADPLELWKTLPFEPTIRDGRLFARGVSDDKGQLLLHVQAIEALMRADGALPINIRLLFEGEEEIGSPHLGPFVRANHSLLQADVLLVSDTGMVALNAPTICCGLRGITTLEIGLYGANTDLHSGLYGGGVPNPLHAMTQLLASLHHRDGRVAVEGFYDDVVELTAAERTQLAGAALSESELAKRLGLVSVAAEPGYTATECMSIRPTVEINGLFGGFQGEGVKTVIPRQAHAKISCRLVPNQDPEVTVRRVSEHLRSICPHTVHLDIQVGHGGRPWACDPSSPALQAARRALEQTFAKPVAFVRMGGSIPVIEVFAEVLQVPIVLMGFAPPDDNAHAPNENFPLSTYRLALQASCRTWHEMRALA
jgi:acetylornithine deacetylase/succinyl-diaminopimelate desuccinylase-like protein